MLSGAEIYKLRSKTGMSVRKFAKRTGLSTSTIYRIEMEKVHRLHKSTVYILAEALGVPVEVILGDDIDA